MVTLRGERFLVVVLGPLFWYLKRMLRSFLSCVKTVCVKLQMCLIISNWRSSVSLM